jgi:hypothetical protein
MEIIVAVIVRVWAAVGKENLITGIYCTDAIHRDPVIYPSHFTPLSCPGFRLTKWRFGASLSCNKPPAMALSRDPVLAKQGAHKLVLSSLLLI